MWSSAVTSPSSVECRLPKQRPSPKHASCWIVHSQSKGPALNMHRVGLSLQGSFHPEGHYRRSYLSCFSLFLVPPTEGSSSREMGIMAQKSCSQSSGGILSANQYSKLVRDIVRQRIYSCIYNKRLLYPCTERDLQKGARSSYTSPSLSPSLSLIYQPPRLGD